MVVSDKNPFPTESWLDFIFKSATDVYEGLNRWVIENRRTLFPIYINSIDWLSQFLKNQGQLWYDTQNEIYRINEPYLNFMKVTRDIALKRINNPK
jgi:hypothetical protein